MHTHRALSPPANTQATSPLLHDHFWHDFNERQVRSALAKLKPHAQPVDTERESERKAEWLFGLNWPLRARRTMQSSRGAVWLTAAFVERLTCRPSRVVIFFWDTHLFHLTWRFIYSWQFLASSQACYAVKTPLIERYRSQGSPEERIRFGFLHEGWHFQPDSQACLPVGSLSILIQMYFTFRISDFIMITFIRKVFFSFLQLLGSWLSLIVQPCRFFSFWPFCPPRQTESLHVDCKS